MNGRIAKQIRRAARTMSEGRPYAGYIASQRGKKPTDPFVFPGRRQGGQCAFYPTSPLQQVPGDIPGTFKFVRQRPGITVRLEPRTTKAICQKLKRLRRTYATG